MQLANIISKHLGDKITNLYFEDESYPAAKILSFLENLRIKYSIITIDYFQLIHFDITYEVFLKKLSDIAASIEVSILLQYEIGKSAEHRGGDKIPKIRI